MSENSVYLALSRQISLQQNMDVIANNIANVNTTGFRGQNLIFNEFLADQDGRTTDKASRDDISFVYNRGQYQTEAAGSLRFTGNDLDVALEGPGFFGVQGNNGEILYTRAGEFQLSPDGTLLNSAGYSVAGQGGGNIVIPPDSTEVSIDERGFISNQNGQLGQLNITEFANIQTLEPVGDTLYRAPVAGQASQNTRVLQGQVEGANVNAVTEVTRMIETLRTFQATQRMIQGENERLRSMIQSLTDQG